MNDRRWESNANRRDTRVPKLPVPAMTPATATILRSSCAPETNSGHQQNKGIDGRRKSLFDSIVRVSPKLTVENVSKQGLTASVHIDQH